MERFDAPSLALLSLLAVAAVVSVSVCVWAGDAEPLQDICVADLNSTVKVNGFVCKAAELETVDDFSSTVISKSGNISSKLGALVTLANVAKFPGLNTFGVSMARIDYAVGGLNPPHIHPRASELLFLEKGSLYVGFVTTENKLFAKTIVQGDLFLFPKGLIHFQLNVGDEAALGIAALTSQNPGTSQVARATFASMPPIESAVLSKAFQIGEGEVKHLMEVIRKT
ncbi:hypothetical protein GOP47_0006895 [Adiantum capillus-veneris]|uniref:Germin-like protein n=1 Tax=Adiantum capillus-veneris TaxID=13818 RepID=A0A9D4ZKV7_ADICA|nr:hypothetical protein GOP47_0006895 [Adiantum capillus-veneris]